MLAFLRRASFWPSSKGYILVIITHIFINNISSCYILLYPSSCQLSAYLFFMTRQDRHPLGNSSRHFFPDPTGFEPLPLLSKRWYQEDYLPEGENVKERKWKRETEKDIGRGERERKREREREVLWENEREEERDREALWENEREKKAQEWLLYRTTSTLTLYPV